MSKLGSLLIKSLQEAIDMARQLEPESLRVERRQIAGAAKPDMSVVQVLNSPVPKDTSTKLDAATGVVGVASDTRKTKPMQGAVLQREKHNARPS